MKIVVLRGEVGKLGVSCLNRIVILFSNIWTDLDPKVIIKLREKCLYSHILNSLLSVTAAKPFLFYVCCRGQAFSFFPFSVSSRHGFVCGYIYLIIYVRVVN